MVNKNRFFSIRWKFGAILVAFLFLTLGTLGVFLNTFNTNTLKQQIRQRDEMLARNIQQSINQVLFAGKYQAQAYIESLAEKDSDIRYIIIIDRVNKRAIAHTDTSKIGTVFDDPVTERALADISNPEPLYQSISTPEGDVHDLSLPYLKGYLRSTAGVIRIGLSATEEEQILQRSLLYTTALILLFLLAGLLLTIALTLNLSSKLNRLLEATKRFGNGYYETQVPIATESQDEFDVLGTAFNQMARKLHSYAESLEHQVQERTEQLEKLNETLREQYNQLKQLDRMKDEFLSVISHELRTPLNAILGFGSLLEDEVAGSFNKEQHDYLRRMLDATERMLFLINDLLDYARIQAGKFSIAPEETDYSSLIKEVIDSFEASFLSKNITVTTDIQPPPSVMMDRQRIFQVLSNLISNSVKFIPKGGKIHIRVTVQGHDLVTEVQDNGLGIAREDLDKLFTPFKQLDMGLTRKVGGVGLGLSISKAIVEAHHGCISAYSSGLDQGTNMCFSIPLLENT